MKLTKQQVLQIYEKIIALAQKRCKISKYNTSLKYIRAAASWAYSFNFFYSDITAENLIKEIADKTLSQRFIASPADDKFVLIDSFAYDNRGLTQQYLRAMMSMNVSILYILTNYNKSKGKNIFRELNEYPKAATYTIPKGLTDVEKSQAVINQIVKFSPSKIFLHLTPWDITALTAIHKIKNVVKYNINLTDHAYWLGASFIDYNIEFRAYGKTISLEKRGLLQAQELCLPYYPVIPKWSNFQGFPPEIQKNSIIIFTGGSPYKMLGRNDVFFVVMDQLLDISPLASIIIAGVEQSNEIFKEKIKQMKNYQRVFLIGNRTDINECFNHCDIFLGTYPTIGGLMAQYAAMNAKPILAYKEATDNCISKVEDVINQRSNAVQTYTNLTVFLQYAKRLIEDQQFRMSEGENNAKAIITPSCFDQEFFNLICQASYKRWDWDKVEIQYDAIMDRYFELQKDNDQWKTILIRNLKLNTLILFPELLPHLFRIVFFKLKNKIC